MKQKCTKIHTNANQFENQSFFKKMMSFFSKKRPLRECCQPGRAFYLKEMARKSRVFSNRSQQNDFLNILTNGSIESSKNWFEKFPTMFPRILPNLFELIYNRNDIQSKKQASRNFEVHRPLRFFCNFYL